MLKRLTAYFVILLIPSFFAFSFVVYKVFQHFESRENNVDFWKGKQLPYQKFYNIDGTLSQLDYSTKYTVIDFWFVGCPWCIKEMVHFEDILSRHKDQIQIYSISTDKVSLWKSFVTDEAHIKNSRLKFLGRRIENWHHYSLSPVEEMVNNYWPLAKQEFKVTRYPTYFIIDSRGRIVTVTNSLKKFVEVEIEGNSRFWLFIKNLPHWNYKKKFILAFVAGHSLFTIILVLGLNFFKKRNLSERKIV
jgi:thiol-disulfide isomerase/thioredoxin